MTRADATSLVRPGHALLRARGAVRYTDDTPVPGALHAKLVRSQVAHGTVVDVDRSDALAVDGVTAVLTLEDLRKVTDQVYIGPAYRDQPILAEGCVRHFGEPVAIVLAEDARTAAEAAGRVLVDIDELPVVLDEIDALEGRGPDLHENLAAAADFEDLKTMRRSLGGNVYVTHRLRTGDFDAVAAHAARVVEHHFHTASVCATPLETISTAVVPLPDGGLEVHTQTQMPSYVRKQLARIFGLPESAVRVTHAPLGGGYGLKIYLRLEALVAASALVVGRPVVLKTNMEEQFYLPNRRGTTSTIASALDEQGNVLARRCRLVWNGGAYADIGPRMVQKSGLVAAGPYDIPVVDIESYGVYTNRVPAGAIRGFGVPQAVWAHEMHTSMLAAEVGADPVEYRLRNLIRRGAAHATGTPITDSDAPRVLERAQRMLAAVPAPKIVDEQREGWRFGRGLSIGHKAVITPSTSVAKATLAPDGSVTVHCGTVEMGQGATEAMARLTAEQMNVPVEHVRVVSGDTDSVPWDTGTMGSRSTYHMARAISRAVGDIRGQLVEMLTSIGGDQAGDWDPFKVEGGVSSVLKAHFGAMGASLVGVGDFTPEYRKPGPDGLSDRVTEYWMCGATGVDLAVDPATGVLKILRLISVADVGRAVEPQTVHTQLSGAAIMQASMSVAEHVEYDDRGQLVNPGLAFYRIFGFGDAPAEVLTDYVEYEPDATPKGVGESGSLAVAPAIAAALHNALGVWVTSLPLTPETILRTLEGAAP